MLLTHPCKLNKIYYYYYFHTREFKFRPGLLDVGGLYPPPLKDPPFHSHLSVRFAKKIRTSDLAGNRREDGKKKWYHVFALLRGKNREIYNGHYKSIFTREISNKTMLNSEEVEVGIQNGSSENL